jgi:hypothetical protein
LRPIAQPKSVVVLSSPSTPPAVVRF